MTFVVVFLSCGFVGRKRNSYLSRGRRHTSDFAPLVILAFFFFFRIGLQMDRLDPLASLPLCYFHFSYYCLFVVPSGTFPIFFELLTPVHLFVTSLSVCSCLLTLVPQE